MIKALFEREGIKRRTGFHRIPEEMEGFFCVRGFLLISSCNQRLTEFAILRRFQMQIINPGQKNAAPWGGNFLLDSSFPKEYFLAGCYPSCSLVNPTTKPPTF